MLYNLLARIYACNVDAREAPALYISHYYFFLSHDDIEMILSKIHISPPSVMHVNGFPTLDRDRISISSLPRFSAASTEIEPPRGEPFFTYIRTPRTDYTRYACNSLTSRCFALMRLPMQMSALSAGIYR